MGPSPRPRSACATTWVVAIAAATSLVAACDAEHTHAATDSGGSDTVAELRKTMPTVLPPGPPEWAGPPAPASVASPPTSAAPAESAAPSPSASRGQPTLVELLTGPTDCAGCRAIRERLASMFAAARESVSKACARDSECTDVDWDCVSLFVACSRAAIAKTALQTYQARIAPTRALCRRFKDANCFRFSYGCRDCDDVKCRSMPASPAPTCVPGVTKCRDGNCVRLRPTVRGWE